MQPLFSVIDAAMIRISTGDPREGSGMPWPEGPGRDTPAAWKGFITKAWASSSLASAIELASPALAATISKILSDSTPDPKRIARSAMALARYIARIRGRATPFGLFVGVAPVRVGSPAELTWGVGHPLCARADARWLASVVASLEAIGSLRARLQVRASDLLTVRGNRIVVGWLPQASLLAQDTPVEISLARTPAAEAVLSLARTPIAVSELADRIATEFPPSTARQADALVSQLMACGALVSSLRPPFTEHDGLAHLLGALDAAGARGLPDVGQIEALRDTHSRLRCAVPGDLKAIAADMRELAEGPANPVAVDLRADCHVTIPRRVADEAAAAASALVRLSPQPHAASGWHDYHARFLDRYGLGTAVSVLDLLNPVTGLGLPTHYAALPATLRSARDERLAALAQQAVIDGLSEIVLDDTLIAEISEPESADIRPIPHMDITIDVRAASTVALDEGAFTIIVCGVGRTALAASGRFLHLLTSSERERLTRLYYGLPTSTRDALSAQLSFPPRHPRVENVTRVPLMLPYRVSLGEYQSQDHSARILLGDLAVTASADRLHLISMSRGVPVEPVLACAPAWHAVPPAARLLFELPRAHCPPAAVFDWGTAAHMPFLPRIRLGRTVLAPARWRIPSGTLPGPEAEHGEWTAAVGRLRDRLRLPEWVSVGPGDRQLRLNLYQPMDRDLLRAHLDASGRPAVLTESWSPDDHAWCGGRAHEIVIPLAAATPPGPPPKLLARSGVLPAADCEHAYVPGSGEVLSARLYSDPALFDLIVTGYLPALVSGWDDLARWWFIRYRDPRHHLRLRLHAADGGLAAARVGRWAAELCRQGLASDLVLDTYRPETGRFGTGLALAAAEALFAADSAAAAVQLAAPGIANQRALTAASLTDLAARLRGGRHAGMQWLAANKVLARPVPLDRDARRLALTLAASDAVPATVWRAWSARADAAGKYARLLAESGRDPAGIVETLLHLHHNRVHGPGPDAEAYTYRLARACALRSITSSRTGTP